MCSASLGVLGPCSHLNNESDAVIVPSGIEHSHSGVKRVFLMCTGSRNRAWNWHLSMHKENWKEKSRLALSCRDRSLTFGENGENG